MRIATPLPTLTLLAALAVPAAAPAAEKPCDPTTQTLKCCNERGGTWQEETLGGKTISYCLEKRLCFDLLESEPNTLTPMVVEDVRLDTLCIEPAIDFELKDLVVRNRLPLPVDALVLDLPKEAAKQATPVELPAGRSG